MKVQVLYYVALTWAPNKGKPLWVLQADVQRDFALGPLYQGGVGQAHLQGVVVLCPVAKRVPWKTSVSVKIWLNFSSPWVSPPGPAWRILYGLCWQLGPEAIFRVQISCPYPLGSPFIPEVPCSRQGWDRDCQTTDQKTDLGQKTMFSNTIPMFFDLP